MNKHIRAIVGDPHPECGVRGHRVHTTISATGEDWPEWGKTIYGIGCGFIHFESDKDSRDWRSATLAMSA